MRLDVVRVLAHQITLEHVDQEPRDQIRMKRNAVCFAHPVHVALGAELHKHEVATAVARGRIADDKGLDVRKFHRWLLITE